MGITQEFDIDQLIRILCDQLGVSVEEIKGSSRVRPLPDFRKMIWHYLRTELDFGNSEVAVALNKHHSIGAKCLRDTKNLIKQEKGFRDTYSKLMDYMDELNNYPQCRGLYKDAIKALTLMT